ncbi:MAG: hypothetical protein K0R65_848 [Crocinitomicaceae bacterium]|jgi:hypothetical protein|nr:hypothetical protein [Crocinitomicaceae bacterium]
MKKYKQFEDSSRGDENDDSEKRKKKGKKDKDLQGLPTKPNLYQQYSQLETKGNLNNSLIKSGAEALAGGAIAPYLSATLGTKAPLLGLALIFAGNYLDDKSGLLKTAGAGVLAHSVAKAKEYRAEPEKTFKDRIAGVTDDLLHMMLIRRYDPAESQNKIATQTQNPDLDKVSSNQSPVIPPDLPQKTSFKEADEDEDFSSSDFNLKGWNSFLGGDFLKDSNEDMHDPEENNDVDSRFY